MALRDILPPVETVLEMEPEDLGPFLLEYLATQGDNINRYNFTLPGNLGQYAGPHVQQVSERLMEAWVWLEREGFLMPRPGHLDAWTTITRRGRQVLEAQDFTTYKRESVLRAVNLDAILVRKVKPAFLRGDYDTAIFQAFKEVEVRVRKKGDFPDGKIGVALMRDAFRPGTGPLTDKATDAGEQVATMELFAGAIGRRIRQATGTSTTARNRLQTSSASRISC